MFKWLEQSCIENGPFLLNAPEVKNLFSCFQVVQIANFYIFFCAA